MAPGKAARSSAPSRPRRAVAPPARRSQAVRRAETRRRLLSATIDCLSTAGYAGTTTTEVCARASVSQGALFKHFATKAELLSAAAEQLFADLVTDYRTAFAPLAASEDPSAAAVDVLWDVLHQPRLRAAFELYLAARTERDLAESLGPVTQRHSENLRAEARTLFPDAAQHNPDFEALVDVLVSAVQGEAIGPGFGDPRRAGRLRACLTRLAREALATPAVNRERNDR
jgi:AcrR family transcriptional regulator